MTPLLGLLKSLPELLLVVIGFGLIVFVHELGHFVAAKWAGIRVLAFAMGFGPAVVTWRQGLGWRRGSSEPEVLALQKEAAGFAGERREHARAALSLISPTEYRLNWLPFGGYVKMLGQDDLDPTAVSTAPDSYQQCPVWKRMVVISAGVVMNILAAAFLFICVFMHGLETEPAKIGVVAPGLPASRARAVDASLPPGLKSGDTILSINGRPAQSFNDLMMASAMSGRGEPMRLVVSRRGVERPVEFDVTPQASKRTRLMEIGVTPAFSAKLGTFTPAAEFARLMKDAGVPELEPGMRLIQVGANADIQGAGDLIAAVQSSGGEPIEAVFEGEGDRRVTVQVRPRAQLQTMEVATSADQTLEVNHLLGLVPLLSVKGGKAPGEEPSQNLKVGDVFAQIDTVEFPSTASGIVEVKRHSGKQIPVTVLRQSAAGLERVRITPDPTVHPTDGGQVGFVRGDTSDDSTLVAAPPATVVDPAKGPRPAAAASVITRPGTRILSVNGAAVGNFSELRAALRAATKAAFESHAGEARVTLSVSGPAGGLPGAGPAESVEWSLSRADIADLHELGWECPIPLDLFETEEFVLRAQGSGLFSRACDAISRGLSETERVMVMTYATFERLFQGTVKVEHLKGPVGIAHMGTTIASRGITWLLFFMALISVNLAVVNFLPLPIVDGGQFIFLVLEGIRGKPVSVQVQNIATIAGLLLIGTMFLIVTYHDVVKLFG